MRVFRSNSKAWAAAVVVTVLLIMLGTGVASGQSKQQVALYASLAQAHRALQTQDAGLLTDLYTADASLTASGKTVSGHAAILKENQALLGMGVRDFRDEESEVYGSGEYAVEVTLTSFLDDSGRGLFAVRMMNLWKNAGGQWRIYRSIIVPAGGGQS